MNGTSHSAKRYRELLSLAQAAARRLNVHQLKLYLNEAVKSARIAGIAIDASFLRELIAGTRSELEELKLRALRTDEDSAEAAHYGNLAGRLAYLTNNLGL